MARSFGGLALLLVVASAVPAAAEVYSLNLTGNSTWAAPRPWERLVTASLAVTAPNGAYPEVRDGNGSLLWTWAGRNVSVSAAWDSGNPYVGPMGYNGHMSSQEVEVPVDMGNATCIGNRTMTASFSSGWAEAWTTTPYILAAVAGDNYSAPPFWNSTVGLVRDAAYPLSYSIVLPPNVSRVWLREINDTATGPSAPYTGYLKLGTVSAAAAVVPGCAPEPALLGSATLPLRFNGSGNFTVAGSAGTNLAWVKPWAMVAGANVTANFSIAGAGAGGLSFNVTSETWVPVASGTYTGNANWSGKGCEGGAISFLTFNGSGFGCVVVGVSAPAPPPAVAAAGGGGSGGGGGGGSEPAPAPAATPASTPAPAPRAAAVSTSHPSPAATDAVARAMAGVVVSIFQSPARQNEAYAALGEAIARWGGAS